MGQDIQKFTSLGPLQLDADEKRISPEQSPYRLNVERSVNNRGQLMGGSVGIKTPAPANRLLNIDLPPGTNTTVKAHESKKTGATYVFVHNSFNIHQVYRVNRDLTIQRVFVGPELDLSDNPRHTPRVHLYFNENSANEKLSAINREYLIYTTGEKWQKFIDVETSIATNSFQNVYFFSGDRRELIQLATRPPLRCITGEFVTEDVPSPSALNKLIRKTWQFRQKFIYTDGRPTSWGPISSTFMVDVSPCQLTAEGLPTCIDLKLDAGNAHVEKIVVAFRNCAGNFDEDAVNSDWYEYDTFDKYSRSLDVALPFYTRTVRGDMGYDPQSNTFTYRFCGNKKCVPVPRAETNQNFIPVPTNSYALMPLDDRLMLLNNEKGFDPIDREALAKFTLAAEEPVIKDCKIEMATVKFSIIIHNQGRIINQFIYIMEDDNDGREKYYKMFGGLGPRTFLSSPLDDVVPYKQFFADKKQHGFIVYVEGTPYYGITTQHRSYGMNIDKEEAKIGNMRAGFIQRRRSIELSDNEFYFIQTGELKVPKGTKGFLRIASQGALRTSQFQDTSTSVMGVMRNRSSYQATSWLDGNNVDQAAKEIYFDTCNGDVDLINTPFVIEDLTTPFARLSLGDASTAMIGYLRDIDGRPVTRAQVVPFGALGSPGAVVTDHNGFFYITQVFEGTAIVTRNTGIEFYMEHTGCVKKKLADWSLNSGARPNEALEKNVTVQNDEYNKDFYATIDVKIQDINGVPIPGINIAAAGIKARTTNANGIATLFVRHDMIRYGTQQFLRVVVMQSGLCYLTTGDCQACMPTADVELPLCFSGPIELTLDTLPAFNTVAPTRGLQPGGLYPFALKFMDAAGRETFAQGDYLLQLPTVQEKQAHNFSRVRWNITGRMNLPSEFTKMAILIGKNRLWEDSMEWVADKVEFVDNRGEPATNVSADKVRISIQSLYSTQRKFNLGYNVKYEFKPGDKLQFVANADGKIFPDPIDALTFSIESEINNRDYLAPDPPAKDKDGNDIPPTEIFTYLLIPYNKVLTNLKAGAKVRIFSEYACETQGFYYETCPLIDIQNGEPVTKSGLINTFDSYFVRRLIEFDDMVQTFTFPFLHHAPSDFWGDHCIDRGRVSVSNIYEKKLRYGRNAMISRSWLVNGNYNGLSVFGEDLSKTFSGEQRGDITAAVSVEQVLMVICEYDSFMARVADDFVRIGSDGILKALAAEAVVGDAEMKFRGFFGCQYQDVKTVITGDGWVFWVDAFNAAPIFHNFQEAKNLSIGTCEGYFHTKMQLHRNNGGQIISGWDPVAKQIFVTFFRKDNSDINGSYVHNRPEVNYLGNETLAFSLDDGKAYTFYSFTPEQYGTLMQTPQGNLFLTFREGKPFLHREMNTAKWNEFYGVPVDQVLEFVVNQNSDKVKKYLAMQVQTTIPFFADRILTSEGQVSIIPPVRAAGLMEGKTDNGFLFDRNSPGGLYKGRQLVGYWMRVRLVRENSINFKIGTVDRGKQVRYSELDSILVKYMWSEQSGYNTGNQ